METLDQIQKTDFSAQFKEIPAYERALNSLTDTLWSWTISLADRQHEKPNERVHRGLLVAIVDHIGYKVLHTRHYRGDDPLRGQTIEVPIRASENDKTYDKRFKTFCGTMEGFEIQKNDGAILVARSRLVLGSRIEILTAEIQHDPDQLPAKCGARHTAALAASNLDTFLRVIALSDESNIVTLYKDGIRESLYNPEKTRETTGELTSGDNT